MTINVYHNPNRRYFQMPAAEVVRMSRIDDQVMPYLLALPAMPAQPVATVATSELHVAFRATNTVDQSWWTHDNVSNATPARSTSVGDIMEVVESGKYFIVMPRGFVEMTVEEMEDARANARVSAARGA